MKSLHEDTLVEIIKNVREKKLARTMNKGTIQTLPGDWHWELRLSIIRLTMWIIYHCRHLSLTFSAWINVSWSDIAVFFDSTLHSKLRVVMNFRR